MEALINPVGITGCGTVNRRLCLSRARNGWLEVHVSGLPTNTL